jgi:hypothetical protein
MTNNNGFWIGLLDLLTPSFTISRNHNQSSAEPFFLDRRGFALFSFSFCDWLLIYDWTTYIVSRKTHRKHIRCPAMGTYEPHRKHLFLYCFNYSALHSNGSYPIVACVFVVAGMCLLSRCPATGLHVTIYFVTVFACNLCIKGTWRRSPLCNTHNLTTDSWRRDRYTCIRTGTVLA